MFRQVSRVTARSGKKDAETLKALDTLKDDGSSVLRWLKERFFHVLQNHNLLTIISIRVRAKPTL